MGETLSEIIKSRVDDQPWDGENSAPGIQAKAADGTLTRARVLAAIGAMSLMAAFGIWVGEFLRLSGR